MPPRIPDWVIERADRDMRRLGSRIVQETLRRTGKETKVLGNLRELMAEKARGIKVEPFRQAYMQRIEDLADDMIERVSQERIRIGRLSPDEERMVSKYFADIDAPRPPRQQAARQARRQAPARQRQQLPAIPEQAPVKASSPVAETVKQPIVRVGVRDLPENIRPLGAALDRANQAVDQRQYTLDRVRAQETGPVTREQGLLDDAIETRNRAQAALEEAIDRNIPEGDRPRIKQGLRNNKILRAAGKGVMGMAALSQAMNIAADNPGKVKEVFSDTLEAAKSPVRTAKEFGKEAADFYRIMTGGGGSAKAIKKKMGKDVKKADKAAFDFLLKTVLSPEQIKAATQPKEPQA